jgi:hypothetical protein
MKKNKDKTEPMVQPNIPGRKPEKLWLVGYFTVRRHSRVLYLPLDPVVTKLHGIEKGDIVKAVILQLRKAPRPDEPLREVDSGKGEVDPGIL